MLVHCFQHVPFEGLGSIEPWMASHGHAVSSTSYYKGEKASNTEDYDWLIVMGGPMGVYDEADFPWLKDEKRAIDSAIEAGKTVLGICLGAQLVAEVLGARVYKNDEREIGWHPISMSAQAKRSPLFGSFPETVVAFHWHGDTFDLPSRAVHIASSEACRNQAFEYGDCVVGLQFHLETTPASAAGLVENCANELVHGRFIQPAPEILGRPGRFRDLNQHMAELLSRLAEVNH